MPSAILPAKQIVLGLSLLLLGSSAYGQTVLSLASGSGAPGGSVSLNLSLSATGGSQPAALEWGLSYAPANITAVSFTAGQALTAAGKTLSCNMASGSAMCVASGMNATAIGSGVVAVVTVTLSAGSGPSLPLTLGSLMASLADGTGLPVSGTSGTIAVQTALPTVSGLQCSPASVSSGANSTCTVTLSAAAPAGGASVTLTNTNSILTVPGSVSVAAAATTATFSAAAGTIGSNQSATITATYNSSTANTSISLVAPVTASSLVCNPTSLGQNASSTCTVTLTQAAPTGGAAVALTNTNATLTVPASVTVAAAATTATFNATTTIIGSNQSATITATYNGSSKTATISLVAPVTVSSLVCNPTSLGQNASSTCTVTLSQAAPTGGAAVTLTNTNATLTVPASVTVAAAATTATFNATTTTIASNQSATVTATYNGISANTSISLLASVTVSSLACTPNSLGQNASSTCTVTLTQAAPTGGAAVALTNTNATLTVPASVTVVAAATTATFNATTTTIGSNQSATITATYTGSSKTATISLVAPVTVSSLVCNPTSLGQNASSTCTVTLSQAAPAGGSVVAISDTSATLTTPPSVTVAAGGTTANFTATSSSFTNSQSVTLTAALNGSSTTTTIALTMSAPTITCGASTTGMKGVAFSYQITASNSPTSYGAKGLPAGLTVNSTTGLISGTPTTTGTSTVALSATNGVGTGTANLTLTVISTYFVQTASKAAPTNSKSLSVAFTKKTVTGNLILVAIDFIKSVTPLSITDSQGNPLTQVGTQLNSPNNIGSRVYYANTIKGGSDTITVTLSGKSTYLEMYLTEYSGLNQANPIDAQTGTTGSAGTVSSGNITTTAAGDLLYAFCLADSSCTVGSGFTARSTLNSNYLGDKIAGNPGTYAATGTANAGWTMQVVALKPASAVSSPALLAPNTTALVERPSRTTTAQGVPRASNGVAGLSCSPRAVNPGNAVTCELRVTASAAASQLALESSSAQLKVPATVTTRPHQSSLTFQVFVDPAAQQQSATISTSLNGAQVQETILVMPASGPVLTVPARQIAQFGKPLSFTANAVDPDGLPVHLTVAGAPAGASFDPASGRFEWTPGESQTGKHQVTFTAANAMAQTSTALTTIEVDAGTPVLTPSQELACSANAVAPLTGKWLAAPGSALSDPSGNALELGGAKVKVNGQYVPVLFSSATRVHFLCPALDAGTTLSVTVETDSGVTEPVTATMLEASPAILSLSHSDSADLAAMRNFLAPAHPAQPGDPLLILSSGLGSGPLLVKIGDISGDVESVTAVPGSAGLYAIQTRVPAGTMFGDAVPVQVQVATPGGRQFTSNTVTAAIEPVRQ
jgi:hypothetical protein